MNRDEWVIRIHIYETGLRKWRETLREDTDSMIDSWPWGFGIRYGKKVHVCIFPIFLSGHVDV